MPSWSPNLIHKSGPKVNEVGTRTTYDYEFLCPTALLADSKPYTGDPCPDDEAAICRNVFSESVSPTYSRITATYWKGWTISFTGGHEAGDEEEEIGTVMTAQENTQGGTIRKPHPTWVDKFWIEKLSDSDKQDFDDVQGDVNSNTFRGKSARTVLIIDVSIDDSNPNHDYGEVTYEYNPDGWSTTDYASTRNFPARP